MAINSSVENLNVESQNILITPAELKSRLPLTAAAIATVQAGRLAVRNILDGSDPRLLVVIGPCSIHDPKAAMDYANRLKALSETVKDSLLIVMRVYFEKPRTTTGWKGLINDPHINDSFKIEEGLQIGRKMQSKDRSFDQIMDTRAIRVIIEDGSPRGPIPGAPPENPCLAGDCDDVPVEAIVKGLNNERQRETESRPAEPDRMREEMAAQEQQLSQPAHGGSDRRRKNAGSSDSDARDAQPCRVWRGRALAVQGVIGAQRQLPAVSEDPAGFDPEPEHRRE